MIFYRVTYPAHKAFAGTASEMIRTPNLDPPTPTCRVLYVDTFSVTTGCVVVWVDDGAAKDE